MTTAPEKVTLSADKRTLSVSFADATFALPAELLRVESPSAEVKGHGGPKKLVLDKEDVTITALQAAGNYALRILFSDGHRTGIYSWTYLRELGENKDTLWQAYQQQVLAHLKKVGCGEGCTCVQA